MPSAVPRLRRRRTGRGGHRRHWRLSPWNSVAFYLGCSFQAGGDGCKRHPRPQHRAGEKRFMSDLPRDHRRRLAGPSGPFADTHFVVSMRRKCPPGCCRQRLGHRAATPPPTAGPVHEVQRVGRGRRPVRAVTRRLAPLSSATSPVFWACGVTGIDQFSGGDSRPLRDRLGGDAISETAACRPDARHDPPAGPATPGARPWRHRGVGGTMQAGIAALWSPDSTSPRGAEALQNASVSIRHWTCPV